MTAENRTSHEDAHDPEFECQSCGKRMSDDGADSLLGWLHDEDGELSFCADCGPRLGPPTPEVVTRLCAGAARYVEFKDLLHEHREGALTCYDHPEFYCCTCGEHMALGYQEHLAAILAKRESTYGATIREQVAREIEAVAATGVHAHEEPVFVDAALVARTRWHGASIGGDQS